jgi:hypothetical protein
VIDIVANQHGWLCSPPLSVFPISTFKITSSTEMDTYAKEMEEAMGSRVDRIPVLDRMSAIVLILRIVQAPKTTPFARGTVHMQPSSFYLDTSS